MPKEIDNQLKSLDDVGGAGRGAPGKRSLTDQLVQRRPSRPVAPAADAAPTSAPTEDPFALHLAGVVQRAGGSADASSAIATTAIERKDAGAPLDGSVRGAMESHLGVDFGGVRVHSDAGAQRASAAIGARAFAHQGDIFMGPGESPSDLRLMAHEVTHVAQQGAAGAPAVQRQVTVGAADSPAEKQADAVAEQVTSGKAPATAGRIAADGAAPTSGQMTRADFLAALRAQVIATTRSLAGPEWQPDQCADIQRFFAHHAATDAAALERMAQRYSGLTTATSAADYLPAIMARLSGAIARWAGGTEVSWEVGASGLPRAAEDDGGGGEHATVRPATDLGAGGSLDGDTVTRMSDAFGTRFDDVVIHTDATAARTTSALGADALAVGSHVAFAAGAYQPGTPTGDGLIAHELAHVVQQRGATVDRQVAVSASSALEGDADQAAAAAVGRLHGDEDAVARPALRSGATVARGSRTPMEQHLERGLDGNVQQDRRMGAYVADGMTALNQGHSETSGVHYAKNYRRSYPTRWQDDWANGYADPNYFVRNGYMDWTLRDNRSASEAIKAWLKGLTIAECLSAVVALKIDALRARLGDDEFDRRYGRANGDAPAEIRLRVKNGSYDTPIDHVDNQGNGRVLQEQPAILLAGQGVIGNRPFRKGDWVYFWNHPLYRYKHPGGDWRGENAICMGTNSNGVQIWSGMGAGDKTEQQMLDSMVLAYNRPRDEYDNQKLAQIQHQNGDQLPAAYDPAQTLDLARGDNNNPFSVNQMLAYPRVPSANGAGDAEQAGIDFASNVYRMNDANAAARMA